MQIALLQVILDSTDLAMLVDRGPRVAAAHSSSAHSAPAHTNVLLGQQPKSA